MNHIDNTVEQQAQEMAQMLLEAMTIVNTALSHAKRGKSKYTDLTNNGMLAIIDHQANGGQVMKHESQPEDAEYIMRLARMHHLPVSVVNTKNEDDTVSSVLLYRDIDKQLFENVLKEYRHAMGIGMTEMSTEQFYNRYKEQPVNEITGLSAEETGNFRQNAVDIPYDFTVIKNDDDTYKILYPATHEEEAERILKMALYDITDESKKKQIEKIVHSKELVLAVFESEKPVIFADSEYPNHVFVVHDGKMDEFNIQDKDPVKLQKGISMELNNGMDILSKVMWMKEPVMTDFDEYPLLRMNENEIILNPELSKTEDFNIVLAGLTQ